MRSRATLSASFLPHDRGRLHRAHTDTVIALAHDVIDNEAHADNKADTLTTIANAIVTNAAPISLYFEHLGC